MKQYIPERLVSARLLKGFSLQDLADDLNNLVSKQALHKYESGDVTPSKEMILRLSESLEVNPDFFYKTQKIELHDVEFRKLNILSVKEENRIKETTKQYVSNYLELEEIIGLSTVFNTPLNDSIEINNIEDIDKATQALREKWGLGNDPIYSVVDLLEDNHIKIVEIEAGDEFDGMQAWVNNKSFPVIVINTSRVKKDDRKRFTILHELGHMVLPLAHLALNQREKFCNQFASSMLFPKAAIFKELGINRNKLHFKELGELKRQYGVSIQAIIMRAKDLAIISDSYCRQLFFLIKQHGWKIEEPYPYSGNESSSRFNQLLFRALIEELITPDKAAQLRNITLDNFNSEIRFL